MTALEFCCGAGGSGLGLHRAGIRTLAAYDLDRRAVETYNANLPPVAQVADVRELDPTELPEADLWVATLPCQPFSRARRTPVSRMPDLFPWLDGTVQRARPRMLLLENVREARTVHPTPVCVDRYGYRVWEAFIRASRFGAPQPRERWFLFAWRDPDPLTFSWPAPTHNGTPGALHLLESETPTWERFGVPIRRLMSVTASEGRGAFGWRRREGPPAKLRDFNGGQRVPVEVLAAGQGFPADWSWPGAYTVACRLIGEAVYVPLATAIACEIIAADRRARDEATRAAARAEAARDPQGVVEYLLRTKWGCGM